MGMARMAVDTARWIGDPTPRPPEVDDWEERWRGITADLIKIQHGHPMVDALIDEVNGRMIRIGDRWLDDFASSNYLGFDCEPEIIDAVPAYLHRWGTDPTSPRVLGEGLYAQIEERLTALLGSEDTLVLPTVSHVHTSAIPKLAGRGTIFLDRRAHKAVFDGCSVAQARGARLIAFDTAVPEQLATLLADGGGEPRLICVDAAGAMTGDHLDLGSLAMLARANDALLYIDDTHGFGVVGERGPDELCCYGLHGNSIVRHLGESYDNIVLVAGFSRAHSSLLSFLALPSSVKQQLGRAGLPHPHSAPSLASLATVLEGLSVNERKGEQLRLELHRLTSRVRDSLAKLGITSPAAKPYPTIDIELAHPGQIDQADRFLFDRGIYVTHAASPLMARAEVCIRIHLTSANTRGQVCHLIQVLSELAGRFELSEPPRGGPRTRSSAPCHPSTAP